MVLYIAHSKIIEQVENLAYFQVEEWYKWRKTALHIGEEEKRVYLATDDQTVLRDAIQM